MYRNWMEFPAVIGKNRTIPIILISILVGIIIFTIGFSLNQIIPSSNSNVITHLGLISFGISYTFGWFGCIMKTGREALLKTEACIDVSESDYKRFHEKIFHIGLSNKRFIILSIPFFGIATILLILKIYFMETLSELFISNVIVTIFNSIDVLTITDIYVAGITFFAFLILLNGIVISLSGNKITREFQWFPLILEKIHLLKHIGRVINYVVSFWFSSLLIIYLISFSTPINFVFLPIVAIFGFVNYLIPNFIMLKMIRSQKQFSLNEIREKRNHQIELLNMNKEDHNTSDDREHLRAGINIIALDSLRRDIVETKEWGIGSEASPFIMGISIITLILLFIFTST